MDRTKALAHLENILANTNALQNSTLNTGAVGSQQVTFSVAGTNTYNLGGLAGANALNHGADSLSVGSNNSSNTFSGDLVGTGNFNKTGTGALTFEGNLSGFTGTMTVQNGTLNLPSSGSLGGNLALTGGTLSSRGTVAGNTTLSGGTLLVNPTTPANLSTTGDLTLTNTINVAFAIAPVDDGAAVEVPWPTSVRSVRFFASAGTPSSSPAPRATSSPVATRASTSETPGS
jgi:autotransporter-associated beta strand protein